ncbi:MAG: hypothetical protein SGPRY_001230 [Prymnesium sp.]
MQDAQISADAEASTPLLDGTRRHKETRRPRSHGGRGADAADARAQLATESAETGNPEKGGVSGVQRKRNTRTLLGAAGRRRLLSGYWDWELRPDWCRST